MDSKKENRKKNIEITHENTSIFMGPIINELNIPINQGKSYDRRKDKILIDQSSKNRLNLKNMDIIELENPKSHEKIAGVYYNSKYAPSSKGILLTEVDCLNLNTNFQEEVIVRKTTCKNATFVSICILYILERQQSEKNNLLNRLDNKLLGINQIIALQIIPRTIIIVVKKIEPNYKFVRITQNTKIVIDQGRR